MQYFLFILFKVDDKTDFSLFFLFLVLKSLPQLEVQALNILRLSGWNEMTWVLFKQY